MAEPAVQDGGAVSFGPFTLTASERLLTKGGVPVEIGARALDILISLAGRPNEVVGKKDLLRRVWPDVTVEEGSLRFHIANLRKILGDGRNGARYITTLAGRGYCFVAPVSRPIVWDNPSQVTPPAFSQANLPNRLVHMVGRDDDIRNISAKLNATRFVTLVGAGGIGKTTVAVAAGHDLLDSFAGAAHFVDLGALSDASLVTTTITSMLGLSVQSGDAMATLLAYLKDRRILLILDTCEHLIETVAPLASQIFAAAPQVHILATSREALRVDGEQVHNLKPLDCPPDDLDLTATTLQNFPATQLFLDRATARGASIDVNDTDAAIVAQICRKLDGVPLAIELAAGRVAGFGLHKTAALLDQRLTLLWPGHRTAPPRQKTLQATLDWSYQHLSDVERAVLRRLAVFVGHFTIEAALEVVSGPTVDQTRIFEAIDGLVAKSMVAARPAGAMMRYRLLDTTRAYTLQASIEKIDLTRLAERHAAYYLRWLRETGSEWTSLSNAAQRALHLAGLANVRSALEWCLGPEGNSAIGVQLAAAAAPVFLAMSLLTECHRWSEKAIAVLTEAQRGGREEMHLQAALGVSLMFTRGGLDAARMALKRSLAIAEQQGDPLDQLQVLGPLQMFHLRAGEFKTALRYSERCSDTARTIEDSAAVALGHSLMGISLHLAGAHEQARMELESALRHRPRCRETTAVYLGFDGRILAGAILARTLWLQGHPDQAMERARLTVATAATVDHPLSLSIALIWAVSVFLWAGDLASADNYIERLLARAETHSLAPYIAVGGGFKGELAIRQGQAESGVESLEINLRELHAAPYELLTTPLKVSLIQGLVATTRLADAHQLTDETIRSVETNGDLCYLPELFRLKGNLVTAMPRQDAETAEAYLRRSLDLSHRQGARSWQLRTAIDLATLLAARGERRKARALLKPLFGQFVEGLNTADLKAAERLLVTLE